MAMFDTLIDDMAQRFGLGASAGPLIREALSLITGSPGGISGFLNLFKTAGFSSDVASWLGNANAAPAAAQQVERALGSSVVGGFASRFGLGQAAVSTALGYALPKLIGLLTPGGSVPASLPAEVTNFLSSASVHRAAETVAHRPAAPTLAAAQVAPRRIDVYHDAAARDEPVMSRWLWPLLGALALLGLLTFFWPTGNRTTVAPPVAQAPAVAPALPPALLPARLAISNDDGVIRYSGTVHDQETRDSLVNALKSVFGDKVQGDIAVDLNRAAAPWLVNFRNG